MTTQHRSAERRANLFREMSREIQRPNSRTSSQLSRSSRSSRTSAVDNTLTSEEQELFLPPLVQPQTPPKVTSRNQDQQIHTSAARRAFPGFSDPGSQQSPSIEQGRGALSSGRSSPSNVSGSTDPSESVNFTMPDGVQYRFNWDKYNQMLGRKIQSKTKTNRQTKTDAAAKPSQATEKENQDPEAKTTRYGSSRSASNESNAAHNNNQGLNATVESDNESNARSLGKNPSRQSKQAATSVHKVTPKGQQNNHEIIPSGTFSSFNGSFVLPDIPNITELVTGTNKDGTPIYPRTAKILAKHGIAPSGRTHLHADLHGVELPTDEKALYTSLAVLQRRVDELELADADHDAKLTAKEKSLEEKNAQLAAKDKQLAEYGLKLSALQSRLDKQEKCNKKSAEVGASKISNWNEERSEFERTVKVLEERLQTANERTVQNELTIGKLINDKHTAEDQLVEANKSVKELTEESDSIHAYLAKTQKEFLEQTHFYEQKINRLSQMDEELRGKVVRRQKAVEQMGALARELYSTRQQVLQRVVTDTSKATTGLSSYKASVRARSAERSVTGQSQVNEIENESTTGMRLPKRHSIASLPSRPANPAPPSSTHEHRLSKDSDFFSFMEGDEVAKLKEIVSKDKAALALHQAQDRQADSSSRFTDNLDDVLSEASTQKLRREARAREREQKLAEARDRVVEESRKKIVSVSRNESMPLKSSLKPQPQQVTANEDDVDGTILTHRPPYQRHPVIHDDTPLTEDLARARDTTQTSIATSNRHSSRNVENETSQLFLDDITMTTNEFGFPGLPPRRTHMVPRPVPFSDEEPNAKPDKSPGVSLAIIMQSFKEELAQAKERKKYYEAQLESINGEAFPRDRSLRNNLAKKSLALNNRITQLSEKIHIRQCHIMTLYDVLEGQKDANQLMDEEEAEVTLLGFGIKPLQPLEWEGLSD